MQLCFGGNEGSAGEYSKSGGVVLELVNSMGRASKSGGPVGDFNRSVGEASKFWGTLGLSACGLFNSSVERLVR